MGLAWGLIVIVTSMLCWGGQLVSWLAPETAARLGLMEPESEVEPVFWADIRAEALWDSFVLWTMPVAGVLLLIDHDWWPYFGLIGGGAYLYFAGRGVAARLIMRPSGFRIGSPQSVKVGLIALVLWGAMALVTMVSAIVTLESA